jgi:predicted phage terminase large subunit-like protein
MTLQLQCDPLKQQLTKSLNDTLIQTVLNNKWIPEQHRIPQPDGKGLSPQQAEFLIDPTKEILYGGAAGGGKSDALFMGGLQYVDVPDYSGIIFRRTFADLSLPKALIDRSHSWLDNTEARWDGSGHTWHFPSGAQLAFGYMENDADKYRYQSAEFQYIGFDELTQFELEQYRYMLSRLRRLENSYVPLRMRGASNPGGRGHDWVKQRFMVEASPFKRLFIPAKLEDNKNLDRAGYVESLNELDPITRRQYLNGDWNARHGGSIFKREWFTVIDSYPHDANAVWFWDKAATKPKASNKDPDYTVGLKLAERDGIYYIVDVRRHRDTPRENEALIRQTAELNPLVPVYMEQEPGSSGVDTIDHYARVILQGFTFYGIKTTGSKSERAAPVASAAEAGNIRILRGVWNSQFLDEIEAFPLGDHDDQVDALSGAFAQLRHTANPIYFGV